jgi:hypothetical protein
MEFSQHIAEFKAGAIKSPPASTGKDNNNRTAVTNTAHANRGIRCNNIPGQRIFKMVVMKLILPSIEDIPARCRLKIARSTDPPE